MTTFDVNYVKTNLLPYYDLGQLRDLREIVTQQIEVVTQKVRDSMQEKLAALRAEAEAQLQAKIRELAEAEGLPAEALILTPPRKPKSAKYRNPNNPAQTWSGAGKRPGWFTALLAEGLSTEQMEINPLQV